MKIAYILNIFPKISETFILNEILEAQRQGITIEVFALKKSTENIFHADVSKVDKVVYFLPPKKIIFVFDHLYWFLKKPVRYIKTFHLAMNRSNEITALFLFNLHNVKILLQNQWDCLHAHFGTGAADMAMLIHLLTGIPYTFTTHRVDLFDVPSRNYPLKSRLSKKHITISEFNKNYLVNVLKVSPQTIEVIHCGINFRNLFQPPPTIRPNKIITIARLDKIKALDDLIQVCSVLKRRGLEFQSIIIGEGEEREKLENLIKKMSLDQQVHLLGSQTNDSVLEHLNQSKVMVMTSRSEGIPVSLMEGLAMRVPVIATRITGIPELIDDGKNGYLIEVGNIDQLVEKILKLLSDSKLYQEFCEEGYKKVLKHFNLEIETGKLINIWKS